MHRKALEPHFDAVLKRPQQRSFAFRFFSSIVNLGFDVVFTWTLEHK